MATQSQSRQSHSGRVPPRPRSKALKSKPPRSWKLSASSLLFIAVGLVALTIIGYAGWQVWDTTRPFGQQRAQQIDGVVNYREKNPDMLTQQHVQEKVDYEVTPPVGGNHNSVWENCTGDIYSEQIPNEHAVHALEHGSVWITYNPDELTSAEVEKLATKVQGNDYMLMSPYPELDSPISLQAWGFQLKLDSADDSRIDKFIGAFRKEASVEPGAQCSGGVTVTGTEPINAEGMGMPEGGA